VNGYWMCDLGRFGYHWIEGDDRLRRPMSRHGTELRPVSWRDVLPQLRDRLTAAGTGNPEAVRFLLSAHASHEEFFLFRRLGEELIGDGSQAAITVSWRVTEKWQPAGTKFRVSSVDAPNVNGARLLGLVPGQNGDPQGPADVSALRAAVDAGKVSALYVFDPGFAGSIGDVAWVVEARASGRLPLLVVQGVLMTDLARAADFVLPGASSVEKQASYTNDQGRLQGTARAMSAPGEALEDWRVLVDVAAALGAPLGVASDGQVRQEIARRFKDVKGLEGLTDLTFERPVSARTWLQASNPSERWKWDFMYQDLPPVKGSVDASALPAAPGLIPLREVK
jgi:NADH-quinone oxidoreductase subunit G